ncbi:MAG: tetratricopeptide repeat protein [Treponema sp.]
MNNAQQLSILAILIVSLCSISCITEKQDTPHTQSKTVQSSAEHESTKDTLLLFTGSDWSSEQQLFVTQTLTPAVFAELSKTYTVQHIDLPRNTEGHDEQTVKKHYLLFTDYAVPEVPFLVIQTAQHDVYVSEALENDITTSKLFEKIQTYAPMRAKVTQARKLIETSGGAAKAQAIDAFLSIVKNGADRRYDELRTQIPLLDPENRSGLKGKYLLISADIRAKSLAQAGKFMQAADEYKNLAEHAALQGAEAQTAWYLAGYLYSMSGKLESARIIEYFKKAIQADPHNEAVPHIERSIKKLQEKSRTR